MGKKICISSVNTMCRWESKEGEVVPSKLWASEVVKARLSGSVASYWFWCLSRITVLYTGDFCFCFPFLVTSSQVWWDYLGDLSVFSRVLVECVPFLQSALQEGSKLHIHVFISHTTTHTSHSLMGEFWKLVCFSNKSIVSKLEQFLIVCS